MERGSQIQPCLPIPLSDTFYTLWRAADVPSLLQHCANFRLPQEDYNGSMNFDTINVSDCIEFARFNQVRAPCLHHQRAQHRPGSAWPGQIVVAGYTLRPETVADGEEMGWLRIDIEDLRAGFKYFSKIPLKDIVVVSVVLDTAPLIDLYQSSCINEIDESGF